MSPTQQDAAPVSLIGRTFSILDAFTPDRPELTLNQLTSVTGLPRSTVHRLAGELLDWQILERHAGAYRRGPKLFELGGRVPRHRELRDAALPFMEDLYEATHETVHLAVLDGDEVVYVEKIHGHNALVAPSHVGGRLPAYCAAVGKVLLAFAPAAVVDELCAGGLHPRTRYTITVPNVLREQLEEVRLTGLAVEREESRLGLACAAAPVRDARGAVLAAMSVSVPLSSFDVDRLAPAIRTAALGASRLLSGRG